MELRKRQARPKRTVVTDVSATPSLDLFSLRRMKSRWGSRTGDGHILLNPGSRSGALPLRRMRDRPRTLPSRAPEPRGAIQALPGEPASELEEAEEEAGGVPGVMTTDN